MANHYRTVQEVSSLSGVSVRTLHHYHKIGLLLPTEMTAAGYRLYDNAALQRLQSILLFRELQFPLREIKSILDNPDFDTKEALAQQIHLLELQRSHIEELIAFARTVQKEGVNHMDFTAFGKTEFSQYAQEVRERWGSTSAYQEYQQKTQHSTPQEQEKTGQQLLFLLASLGTLRHLSPTEHTVQEKVAELQGFITEHYYTCTNEILGSLGQMYLADRRMRDNIDRAGGDGTAEFASRAIAAYVK